MGGRKNTYFSRAGGGPVGAPGHIERPMRKPRSTPPELPAVCDWPGCIEVTSERLNRICKYHWGCLPTNIRLQLARGKRFRDDWPELYKQSLQNLEEWMKDNWQKAMLCASCYGKHPTVGLTHHGKELKFCLPCVLKALEPLRAAHRKETNDGIQQQAGNTGGL